MPSEFVKDLLDHKRRVAEYMQIVANELFQRAAVHDNSKFSPEEFELYEECFPNLQKYAFGSVELKAEYAKLGRALDHHFKVNRHHPEYFENGIDGMNLIDVIEMVCDWLAASHRSKTSIEKGLEMNKTKFDIDEQLAGIIAHTVAELRKE